MTGIECVAQLVEHLTFNQVAEGSNPSALTIENKDLHRFVSPCFFIHFSPKKHSVYRYARLQINPIDIIEIGQNLRRQYNDRIRQ